MTIAKRLERAAARGIRVDVREWRTAIFESPDVGQNRLLVAFALAQFMDADGSRGRPSAATLADRIGWKVEERPGPDGRLRRDNRAVRRCLESLVAAGWLDATSRPHRPTEYAATDPTSERAFRRDRSATSERGVRRGYGQKNSRRNGGSTHVGTPVPPTSGPRPEGRRGRPPGYAADHARRQNDGRLVCTDHGQQLSGDGVCPGCRIEELVVA